MTLHKNILLIALLLIAILVLPAVAWAQGGADNPGDEESFGPITSYFLFVYTSPIALCAYVAMALFSVFVCGKGRVRKFKGSLASIAVVFFVLGTFSLPLLLVNFTGGWERHVRLNLEDAKKDAEKDPSARNLERVEHLTEALEKMRREREENPAGKKEDTQLMFLAFPTTLALLICYYCVSLVSVGRHSGRSVLDATAGGLASVGANITTTEYDIIDMDTKQKVGETTDTTVGMGCIGLFLLGVLIGLFAPFIICYKFVFYQLIPFLTEPKT
jgi:hypothetical protein